MTDVNNETNNTPFRGDPEEQSKLDQPLSNVGKSISDVYACSYYAILSI